VTRIAGVRMYPRRTVHQRGGSPRHAGTASVRQPGGAAPDALMRKLFKDQGFAPKLLVTDKLRFYASAFR
jgi:hypothetical protein